ncbi:uncharacterized protein LOC133032068 [Cannabis sativa]|uniref:uncharacterized protein LOC133032068 n=1 Tax=Cannabis sativa TaxID=3483 RepID=UPI0029C9C591|nr:uncharacterized protein LOC133032068 [Cannabis sativa]
MWAIWSEKNKVLHGGVRRDGSYIVSYATHYYGNFLATRNWAKAPTAMAAPTATEQHHKPTEGVPWRPPDLNGIKLNVDAAINQMTKTLGIGTIIRDHNGVVLVAISKSVQGYFRSNEMEAKALFHSINWASQLQIPVTNIETDALRVFNVLSITFLDLSSFSNLIFDVRNLLSSFFVVVVSNVRRHANQGAHELVKYALELDENVS